MKRCAKCEVEKPTTEFYRHKIASDGLQSWCKDCKRRDLQQRREARREHFREQDRQYRAENPERYREKDRRHREANREACNARSREQSRRLRERNAPIMAAAKDRPCVDCGEQLDPALMHFDHVRGGEKVLEVSRMTTYSVERLEAEIAKCDVRCASCHRKRHAGEKVAA
jgi:hypothetical protein